MDQPLDLLPSHPTADQIARLEGYLLQAETEGAGVVLETVHHFAEGQMARTLFIPRDTALTGAVHKHEHLNICCGDITVWTQEGMRRLTGYHVITSLPGTKRAGYAHADTWWTTVHLNPGNGQDVEALENALIEDAHRLQSRRLSALAHNSKEVL